MAYKFQIGAARLSGSITQTDGASISAQTSFKIGSATIDETELSILDGATVTTAELNILDGVTATTAELNYLDGADANINSLVLPAGTTISAFAKTFLDDETAAAAQSTLQLVPGTDVQAYDAQLADIAGLTPTDGNIIVGDGSNFVAESGATARSSLGLGTSDNVQFANITGSGISSSSDVYSGGSFFGAGIGLSDASGLVSGSGGLAQTDGEMHLDPSVAGAGLDLSSGVLSLNIDELTALGGIGIEQTDNLVFSDDGTEKKITFSNFEDAIFNNVSGDATIAAGGALTIANGAVENDMLAGSIGASKLAGAIFEDLETLGAVTDTNEIIVSTGAGAFAYQSGNTARTSLGLGTGNSPQFTNLTLSGDLTVNGTQTIINSTAVEIADKNILLASGSANGAAAAGAGLTIEGPEVQWKYEQNGENNAAADASSSGDIWIASGSAGLVDIQAANFYGTFVGDGAELTGVIASSMVESLSTKTADYTLDQTAETIVLADASSNNVTLTLPAASGLSGVVIKVKRIDNVGANTVSIAPDTGESLEFVADNVVSLDTQGAALSLVCNGTAWFIM